MCAIFRNTLLKFVHKWASSAIMVDFPSNVHSPNAEPFLKFCLNTEPGGSIVGHDCGCFPEEAKSDTAKANASKGGKCVLLGGDFWKKIGTKISLIQNGNRKIDSLWQKKR